MESITPRGGNVYNRIAATRNEFIKSALIYRTKKSSINYSILF